VEKEDYANSPLLLPKKQKGYVNIQYLFDNTFNDIWEYKAKFSQINFHDWIGECCPICDNACEYAQIRCYCRYAIDAFPFKKAKVPIARFRCKTKKKTFSLLPHQLIPYCQYTVNAIIRTILAVYSFQQTGQQGYHGSCLEMDPDCSATPFLILTWARLLETGFNRGHHLLHGLFPDKLPTSNRTKSIIEKIYLYIKGVSEPELPGLNGVSQAMIIFFKKTKNHLFGTSSSERNRSP